MHRQFSRPAGSHFRSNNTECRWNERTSTVILWNFWFRSESNLTLHFASKTNGLEEIRESTEHRWGHFDARFFFFEFRVVFFTRIFRVWGSLAHTQWQCVAEKDHAHGCVWMKRGCCRGWEGRQRWDVGLTFKTPFFFRVVIFLKGLWHGRIEFGVFEEDARGDHVWSFVDCGDKRERKRGVEAGTRRWSGESGSHTQFCGTRRKASPWIWKVTATTSKHKQKSREGKEKIKPQWKERQTQRRQVKRVRRFEVQKRKWFG